MNDPLRHIESLAESTNASMSNRSRTVLRRYPLTFTLLVLFGATALHEGVKGIIESTHLFEGHPVYMFVIGLVILILTGALYKKLDK
jgi:cytochrome c biogenesis factor